MRNVNVPTPDKALSNAYVVECLQEHWIDLDSRELWIRGVDANTVDIDSSEPGVEYMMATRTIMNLNLLRHRSRDPVLAHLHTCGGSWTEGMAIYDAMRFMPYHVTALSYTHARSMSSIILQAADTRLLMPNSYVMIHHGTLELSGEYSTVISNVRWAERDTKTMLDIYVDRASGSKKFKGTSAQDIRTEMLSLMGRDGDVFLTPKEAIEWGLADGVFDGWKADGTPKAKRD